MDQQRKIDLQSPADLTYLLNNITTAAQEKLDLHIPPSAAPEDGDDAFRIKVEELVHQYITQTLKLALPSISINGLNASPSLLSSTKPTSRPNSSHSVGDPTKPLDPNDPSYESYDARLAERVRNLYAQMEVETTKVAGLRRDAPRKAAAGYIEQLRGEMEREEEVRKGLLERVVKEVGERVERDGGGLGVCGSGEDVSRNWERGVKGLEGLRGVTGVIAKLERAQRASDVVGRL